MFSFPVLAWRWLYLHLLALFLLAYASVICLCLLAAQLEQWVKGKGGARSQQSRQAHDSTLPLGPLGGAALPPAVEVAPASSAVPEAAPAPAMVR